jgi:hypothetical protein
MEHLDPGGRYTIRTQDGDTLEATLEGQAYWGFDELKPLDMYVFSTAEKRLHVVRRADIVDD